MHYTCIHKESKDLEFAELNYCLKQITPPVKSYFLACIVRRMLFSIVAYCLGDFIFSTFTIMGNILISIGFIIYLI